MTILNGRLAGFACAFFALALAGEALSRPWVGVRYVALNLRTAAKNKLPVNKGAWVTSDNTAPAVVPGSPARERAVRTREGRLHRRDRHQEGPG